MQLLAQAESADLLFWSRVLQPNVLPFVVAIVAIVIFGGRAIICSLNRHRERMEMIRSGMHPDHPDAGPDAEGVSTAGRPKDTAHYGD